VAEVGSFHALVSSTVPDMIAARTGRIIAVSSIMSRLGSAGFGSYAAAKAAIDGAMFVLAREVGPHGITANVVAPGAVQSRATEGLASEVRGFVERATPAGRMAEPSDIGDVVAMLASHRGRWINGQYLVLDGGLGGPLPFTWKEIVSRR
jgi:NAD(P)-dependent dehydrogenase (short-subunit alcohol dehydrogenase family)